MAMLRTFLVALVCAFMVLAHPAQAGRATGTTCRTIVGGGVSASVSRINFQTTVGQARAAFQVRPGMLRVCECMSGC